MLYDDKNTKIDSDDCHLKSIGNNNYQAVFFRTESIVVNLLKLLYLMGCFPLVFAFSLFFVMTGILILCLDVMGNLDG